VKIHVVAPLHRPIPAACRKPADDAFLRGPAPFQLLNVSRLRGFIRSAGAIRCLTFPTGSVQPQQTPMNSMKPLSISLTVLLLVVALAGLEGCASMDASNTESLLSAAGFRTRTPSTPKQQALYSQLAAYKLERRMKNGKVLYTYADKQKGIVYIGGETEYQQYKRLALQQSIAESQLQAAEINETASLNWGPDWGPWQVWW
jgi:hypothetical protein